MATLDNSPSVFSGESWTTWLTAVDNKQSSDNDTSCDEGSTKCDSSSMKLRKQDMGLYGVCPAQDEFFLSVCERCGQVVKPQALLRHIEQRHGQKSPTSSKKTKSHSSKHGRHSHRSHKTSPSSKADKSHRSRSAERAPREGSEKLKNLPVVKVERIDAPVPKGSISPSHSSSAVYDKPKIAFKETYKEGSRESSSLTKQDTLPVINLRQMVKPEPTSEQVDSLPDLPSGRIKKEIDFISRSVSHKKDLTTDVHGMPRSDKSNKLIDGSTIIVKSELPDLPKKRDRHKSHLPRHSNKSSAVADKLSDSIFLNSAGEIPETFVAKDSEELVEKFEKMESEIENSKYARVQVDRFDDIDPSIKVKIETELQKIKVEDKSHLFQIDNRSSTPVLHIPDSPKSEPPQSPKPAAAVSQPPNAVQINGANSLPNSRPNSRPPSRTNSRPPSRPSSRQGSCPTTPIKTEPPFQSSFKPLSLSSSTGVTHIKQESLATSTSTLTNLGAGIAIEMNSVLPLKNIGGSSFGSSGLMLPNSPSKKPSKDQKFVPCKDRIYDPEKHCGVWINDQARHCTRSLTCKTHSLSLRRGVQGRSKSFDEILNEHKAAKEAILKAKIDLKESMPSIKSPPAAARPTSLFNKPTTPTAKTSTPAPKLNLTKTVTVTTSPPVMSVARSHNSASSLQAGFNSVASQPIRKVVPFTYIPKPAVLPSFSSDESLPLSDTGCDGFSSSDEDGEDKSDDMYLPQHPAPLAVNSWGMRQYGSGCYAFNQCCDRLRNAFSSLVDSHTFSPPHKKLCLDVRSTYAVHSVKDSHKHHHHSDNNDNVIHTTPPGGGAHTNSLFTKQKSKSGQAVIPGRSVKAKPTTSVTPMTTVNSVPNSSFNNAPKQANVNANLKRKRSGTIGNAAASAPAFSSPISITIPTGLNLASLGSTINATLVANPVQAQAGNNNVSIVVSNPDQLNSLMNGQFVNVQNMQSLNLSDSNQLQLGASDKDKNRLSAKIVPALQSKPLTSKVNHQPMQIDLSSGNSGNVMAQLAPGTVLMDTNQGANSFLSSSHVSVDSKNTNSSVVGKVTSQGQAIHSSSATGLVFKKEAVPNGVLSQGTGIQLKNMPISINHLTAANVTVSDLTQTADNTLKLQGRNNSTAAKLPNLPKPASVRPNIQPHSQPISLATLNLTPNNRLVAPANLQQVYANQMLSGVTPLQFQTKNPAKSGSANKMLKQPVALTIVAPGLGLQGTQARPLLLNSDNAAKSTDLTEMTASPGHVT